MKRLFLIPGFLLLSVPSLCQQTVQYPRVTGYAGIVHSVVTMDRQAVSFNFSSHYSVGMPVGLNLWKTPKTGFSFELVPMLRAENGITKTSGLLIHPGILLNMGHGFTFAGRAAFETSGRFGFTPVLNKTVKKNKSGSFFVAVPLPVRFGNDRSVSFTAGFQFGIAF